jgi:hypothetical protein
VAILALNLFDTAVDVVAERYWLFWSYISGVTIKEKEKQNNSKARKQVRSKGHLLRFSAGKKPLSVAS